MRVRTFVKGKHDFGRNPISNTHAKFEAVLYDIPKAGDYMLYLYPDNKSHLFYVIESIESTFTKDLPYIITGVMKKLTLQEQTDEVYNAVCIAMQNY